MCIFYLKSFIFNKKSVLLIGRVGKRIEMVAHLYIFTRPQYPRPMTLVKLSFSILKITRVGVDFKFFVKKFRIF